MQPTPTSGVLLVHVSHAHGLTSTSASDDAEVSGSYVNVRIGKQTERTGLAMKSVNPRYEWDIRFWFANVNGAPSSDVEFEIVLTTSNPLEPLTALGSAVLELEQHREILATGRRVSCTLLLHDEQVAPAQLFISVQWEREVLLIQPPQPSLYQLPTKLNASPARVISFDRRQGKIARSAKDDDIRMTSGTLILHVKHAIGLKPASNGSTSVDAYVRVKVGGCTEQTRTVRGTLSPKFDWEIRFRLSRVRLAPTSTVYFAVCSWQHQSYSASLGTATLALEDHHENLAAGGRLACSLQLEDGQQHPAQLFISFTWEPDDGRRFYPPAVLPAPLPRKALTPRRKTSGTLRVHLSHAVGLRTSNKETHGNLTTFLVRIVVGERVEKVSVVQPSRDPRFDRDVTFRFDHVLVATAGSIDFEALDWDRVGWDEQLGGTTLALQQYREVLADGERVDCKLSLQDGQDKPGQLIAWIQWEYDEAPTPRPRKAKELPPLEEMPTPQPRIMMGLLIGVPIITGLLAWDAEFNQTAILIALVMPFVSMIAYLVTPLTPPEDPSEPPMVPPVVKSVVDVPLNVIYGAKDFVFDNTVGVVLRLVGPVMTPMLPHVAFGIQISMGVSAVISAEEGFTRVSRFGAAVILAIQTAVQLPDSFAWAFDKYPQVKRPLDAFNEKKQQLEGALTVAADNMMQQVQEVMEDAKEANPSLQDSLTLPPFAKPYYRAVCEWLDSIGQIARTSPLKLLVIVLELTTSVNGFVVPTWDQIMPAIPDMPSWTQLQSMFAWATSSLDEIPTAWPAYVISDRGAPQNASGCPFFAPCQVLGDFGLCDSTRAWHPTSTDSAKRGITLVYSPPLLASELVVYYQLSARIQQPMAFSIRLEMNDDVTAWTRSSSDAMNHWREHSRRLKIRKKGGRACPRPPCRNERANTDNTTDYQARVYLVDVFTHVGGGRNVSSVEMMSMKETPPQPFTAFEQQLLQGSSSSTSQLDNSTCASPLRLNIEAVNESFPMVEAIHVSLHSQTGHAMELGLDAIQIVGVKEKGTIEWDELEEMEEVEDEEDGGDGDGGTDGGGTDDGGGDAGGAEFEAPEMEIPVGEIASVVGVAATAAASSDFVRSNVKPDEFAKDQAKESAKKEAQLARSGAEAAIRKLLATPLMEVDVGEALEIIDEAEAQNVLPSLIDKAVEHTERAAQLQFHAPAGPN